MATNRKRQQCWEGGTQNRFRRSAKAPVPFAPISTERCDRKPGCHEICLCRRVPHTYLSRQPTAYSAEVTPTGMQIVPPLSILPRGKSHEV